MDLNLTLPDSVTTWSFLAVGLSTNKGFCVSEALEQAVEQLFFADVRLPYKASRLEEIKIKILIYNYHTYEIKVNIQVTFVIGLKKKEFSKKCFIILNILYADKCNSDNSCHEIITKKTAYLFTFIFFKFLSLPLFYYMLLLLYVAHLLQFNNFVSSHKAFP